MKYLVCYDYGQGGIWAFIRAASRDEIESTFRDLTIFDSVPDVMKDHVATLTTYDVDAPSGWILRLLRSEPAPGGSGTATS